MAICRLMYYVGQNKIELLHKKDVIRYSTLQFSVKKMASFASNTDFTTYFEGKTFILIGESFIKSGKAPKPEYFRAVKFNEKLQARATLINQQDGNTVPFGAGKYCLVDVNDKMHTVNNNYFINIKACAVDMSCQTPFVLPSLTSGQVIELVTEPTVTELTVTKPTVTTSQAAQATSEVDQYDPVLEEEIDSIFVKIAIFNYMIDFVKTWYDHYFSVEVYHVILSKFVEDGQKVSPKSCCTIRVNSKCGDIIASRGISNNIDISKRINLQAGKYLVVRWEGGEYVVGHEFIHIKGNKINFDVGSYRNSDGKKVFMSPFCINAGIDDNMFIPIEKTVSDDSDFCESVIEMYDDEIHRLQDKVAGLMGITLPC